MPRNINRVAPAGSRWELTRDRVHPLLERPRAAGRRYRTQPRERTLPANSSSTALTAD